MNNITSDQVGGIVRALVPVLLTGCVSFGLMDKTTVQALTDPLIAVVLAIAGASTAGAAAWSVYVNQQSQIVKSAAAVAPEDIKIVVGPKASEAIKAIAADPAVPNVARGPV